MAALLRLSSLLAQINEEDLRQIGSSAALFFVVGMLLCCLGSLLLYLFGWWITNRPGSSSPYSGQKMLTGEALTYEAVQKVHDFLDRLAPNRGNRFFELSQAAICHQTGRIFPDSVNRFEVVCLGWNFLQKRFPGRYVSWGSLAAHEKEPFLRLYGNLEDYQLQSSTFPRPQDAERHFKLMKPGPLYADPAQQVLIGWKCVPETDLEVLVVQTPGAFNG